ncbi:phosphatase PAP2 family protein [Rhodococcus sp. HNM0569]|uniref:phosphatase PAP2 family protein n=1 Tax=Rhodococcus sp. HNM0569 TaxID=2716340 RepID=UPI00146BCD6E|nr:phosphatase PAP2 family protein [Rhodococcus sp. HNM0569]NLU84896.1 phosphatase PAP2 family protein [Rhodococcus sp. HNM0569]
MDYTATLRSPSADRALRGLSRAADRSALWVAVAVVLSLAGQRRAAVRGAASVALSSALANGVLKPLFPRRRPPVRTWLTPHRGVRSPRSSSFPSGHSASAAAFTTGVALESPVAGAVVAPLAVAVAYSRVHNGVHWPSDVVAGTALGTGVALATRRWWAVRVDEPAEPGAARSAPALADGAGLAVFANNDAGSENDLLDRLEEVLPGSSIRYLDTDTDFAEQIDRVVGRDAPRALGVCGGDGTVGAVADAAVRHGLPLAVFPGGTLNHFARDVGADALDDTLDALRAGRAVAVDRARIDTDTTPQAPFVNTASLGGYPDAVRMREKWETRTGKWPAAAWAMIRVLADAEPLHVTIDGEPMRIWMLFVGNGTYSPGDQVPMSRPSLAGGYLDVRYLRADRTASRSRLLFAAATGTLGRSRVYHRGLVPELDVRVAGAPVALATDGEVVGDASRFVFRSEPGALTVYRS